MPRHRFERRTPGLGPREGRRRPHRRSCADRRHRRNGPIVRSAQRQAGLRDRRRARPCGERRCWTPASHRSARPSHSRARTPQPHWVRRQSLRSRQRRPPQKHPKYAGGRALLAQPNGSHHVRTRKSLYPSRLQRSPLGQLPSRRESKHAHRIGHLSAQCPRL